jgi:hypothetical protein
VAVVQGSHPTNHQLGQAGKRLALTVFVFAAMLSGMAQSALIPVPPRLTAGDSVSLLATLPSHLPSAGWAASLLLVSSDVRLSLAGTPADAGFQFVAAPEVTAAWAAGRYTWSLLASNVGLLERVTLASGQIIIDPDPAAGTYDPRSHARRVLDAIEAYLERADLKAARTRIADRELQRIPIPELLTLRDRYRADVRAEEATAGLRPVARILTRF